MFKTDADRIQFLLETDAELSAFLALGDLSAEADDERPKYITNYIGSKQRLTDWIWKSTPDDVQTAVDAFSGSSVVGYMYKTHGLGVQASDRLAYCHHIARAIVENDSVVLTDEEVAALLADNAQAKDFVRKHFKGIYFEPGVHAVIDTIRSNIDATGLTGFKKDIALFALGKACLSNRNKGGFGTFTTTQKPEGGGDNPKGFKERFAANCKRISALVFKGERPCKAHHGDTRKTLAGIKADVAYFDPPYATQFSQTNYERAYHFVEGLMTYWADKEIQTGTKTKQYKIPTEVTRSNAGQFFQDFLGAAKHIKHWLISYRDQAFPTQAEIKKIIAAAGKASRMKSKEHQYSISAKHGENSLAKEYLFVCVPAAAASSGGIAEDGDLVALADFGEAVDDSLRAAAPGWDEAGKEFRYRIRPPDQFLDDSFRTKQLEGVDGVTLVMGKFKEDFVPEGSNANSMVVQSIQFTKVDWDLDEAKKWLEEHRKSFAARKRENAMGLRTAAHGWVDNETEYRNTILAADHFVEASMETKPLDGVAGVSLFQGRLKEFFLREEEDPESMIIQAVVFDKRTWTLEKAQEWINEHWRVYASVKDGAVHGALRTDPPHAVASPESNFHTCVACQIEHSSLSAEAAQGTDKRFRFILTHVGTNANGDHFTPDELRDAAKTAVGKKIDLSHAQEIRDIVGGIIEAKFVAAGDLSRVECVGELFVEESESARLAYKLMTREIVGHVSMECDYQEGECSVCGKKIKSRAEYCTHLKNYKGREYKGQLVYEILHGITFTGMGLLDREGADEKAKIQQVADQRKDQRGGHPMADPKKTQAAEEMMVDPSTLDDPGKLALIKKLQAEVTRLTAENEGLQKKLDEAEASRKAVARKAKTVALLKQWEDAGRKFETEAARTSEMDRLEKLSDDAFAATEVTVQSFAAGKKPEETDEEKKKREEEEAKKAADEEEARKKKAKADLTTDAGVKPVPSPDLEGGTLVDKLTAGFNAAYDDRANK